MRSIQVFFLLFLAAFPLFTALSQIAMFSEIDGKSRRIFEVNEYGRFYRNEQGKKRTTPYMGYHWDQDSEYLEGSISITQSITDVEIQSELNKSITAQTQHKLHLQITADRNYNRCFILFVFNSGESPVFLIEGIGNLKKNRQKNLEFNIRSKIDAPGITHVFSNGYEIKSNLNEPNTSVADEFEKIRIRKNGLAATDLFSSLQRYPHKLSPNGSKIASYRSNLDKETIIIYDVENIADIRELDLQYNLKQIRDFHWLNNNELLLLDQYTLKILDLNTEEIKTIRKGVSSILDILPQSPDLIIALARQDFGKTGNINAPPLQNAIAVSKINLNTGRTIESFHKKPNLLSLYFDNQGDCRLRVRNSGVQVIQEYRSPNSDQWVPLDKTGSDNLNFSYSAADPVEPNAFVSGFTKNQENIYIFTNTRTDTTELATYNLNTGKIDQFIVGADSFDIGGPAIDETNLLTRKSTGDLIGIVYQGLKPNVHWLDPKFSEIQRAVDATLKDTVNIPVDFTDDGSAIIYHSYGDQTRGVYHLVRIAQSEVRKLFDTSSTIDRAKLGRTEPFTYKTSDGKSIVSYLTLPPNYNKSPVPLIVFPHGGPTARDTWGFQPDVQYFASRGYAVFQPNYRGSSGFGKKHMTEGLYGEIDGIIIDDIKEGVEVLLKEGIADPKNISIIGYSFGGYAVYMSLIKYPDLYNCGVAVSAISNYKKMLRDDRWNFDNIVSYKFWNEVLTATDNDKEYAKRISPSERAEEISKPLLIVHGDQDKTVSVNQAYEMSAALDKADKNHKLVIFPNVTHNFYDPVNIARLYLEAEQFIESNKVDSP